MSNKLANIDVSIKNSNGLQTVRSFYIKMEKKSAKDSIRGTYSTLSYISHTFEMVTIDS